MLKVVTRKENAKNSPCMLLMYKESEKVLRMRRTGQEERTAVQHGEERQEIG